MKNVLSILIMLGLLLVPIRVNAADNIITIPNNVTFPNGAEIQFKNTCNKPVIVRLPDLQTAITTVVTYGNSATIQQGGNYKLVCSDNTPPIGLENNLKSIPEYSPTTKTLRLAFSKDFDPESGIDLNLSTIKLNGTPVDFVIEEKYLVFPVNNNLRQGFNTIEYNFVNGQGASTGTKNITFTNFPIFYTHLLEIKPYTSITSTMLKQHLPNVYRDSNKNLVIEAPKGQKITNLLTGNLMLKTEKNLQTIKLTEEQYSISPDKITFYYDKIPNNSYMDSIIIGFSDGILPEYQYRLHSGALTNFIENFDIQHLSDKIVIKTKDVGLLINKIGIDYYYFYLTDSSTIVAKSDKAVYLKQPQSFNENETTFTIDLSKLKSGAYNLFYVYKMTEGTVRSVAVGNVYINKLKSSTSTKAYSITVNKDMTTIKINPGATISGIKINGAQAITMNNSIATLSFDTMQIPNWAYDTIEPIITNYTPPTPPTPPTPITSTTIVLQIGSKNMYVNGKLVILDSVPIVRNDRTLLPIRFVAEALGAQVGWDEAQQKVTIQDSKTKIEMWINKPTAIVNSKTVYIDPANYKVVPILVNGRTMLPVRFVSESLGAQVEWNEAQQKVTITK